MSKFLCYERRFSDGISFDYLCDGTHHAERADYDTIDPHVAVKDACDLSCKSERRQVDVRVELARLRAETLEERSITLTTRVRFNEMSRAMFDRHEPITGTRVSSWYGKRNGSGMIVCRVSDHVRVSTRFDWWASDKTDYYQTVDVSIEPCDCAEHLGEVKLTKREKHALRGKKK